MRAKNADMTPLCRNYCHYYKPGKNEELECNGFVVMQRIVRSGKTVKLDPPGPDVVAAAAVLSLLRTSVCPACAFQKEDCDFILTCGQAVPCGGMVLLSLLVERGELRIEEIEHAV